MQVIHEMLGTSTTTKEKKTVSPLPTFMTKSTTFCCLQKTKLWTVTVQRRLFLFRTCPQNLGLFCFWWRHVPFSLNLTCVISIRNVHYLLKSVWQIAVSYFPKKLSKPLFRKLLFPTRWKMAAQFNSYISRPSPPIHFMMY